MTFNLFRTDISQDITAHDLLKTLALLLMFIDHIGAFFMSDAEELRLIGRLSAPIWFFLIGYAMNQKLELRLWVWGFILFVGSVYLKNGMGVLPLNILFTFLLTRATLHFVMIRATRNFEKLFGIFWLCVILGIPSNFIVEYGSIGFLFAMAGYMTRHKDNIKNISVLQMNFFMALTVIAYTFSMWYMFDFTLENTVFLFVLLMCLCLSLLYFKPRSYPSNSLPFSLIKYPLFLTGRRTLEIYVIHFLIFLYIALYASKNISLF